MVWRALCVGAVFLLALTGCPQEFGKNGRIDKAIHKDLMDQLRKSCSKELYQQHCAEGMSLDECLEWCG